MGTLSERFVNSSRSSTRACSGPLLVMLLLLSGCEFGAPDPDQRLIADVAATVELRRIRDVQSEGGLLTPGDFRALQQILDRHPHATLVHGSYRAALIQRSDWASLETFLLQTPPELRSEDHQLDLARVYFRQGNYQDLFETLAGLPQALRASGEFVVMQATALFRLGLLEEAASHLDLHWQMLLAENNSDGVGIRGQILLHQRQFERARDLLSTALEWAPDDRNILLALARAHHAMGEEGPAAAALARADALQAQRSGQARQAMHQVELVNALQQHWASQQYPQVIVLARQALQVLDATHHPILYEYIVEAHRRLGQGAKAEAALAEQKARLQ